MWFQSLASLFRGLTEDFFGKVQTGIGLSYRKCGLWFSVGTVELQANSLWKGVGVNNDGLSVSSEPYLPLRSAGSNHGLHCLGDDQFQEKTGQVSSAGTIWNVPLQVKDNWCKAYQILIPSLLAKGQTLTCFFIAGIPATWGRYFIPLLGLCILYILGVQNSGRGSE